MTTSNFMKGEFSKIPSKHNYSYKTRNVLEVSSVKSGHDSPMIVAGETQSKITRDIYDIRNSSSPGSSNRKRMVAGKSVKIRTSTTERDSTHMSPSIKITSSAAVEVSEIDSDVGGNKTSPSYRDTTGSFLSSDDSMVDDFKNHS